jgi:hypothetical protein
MRSLGELITVQVKAIITTSPYSPQNPFESMHSGTRLEGDEQNILRDVRCSLCDDTQEELVAKAAKELRKGKGRGTVKSAEWSESEGLLMFRGKIYVPKDRELRRRTRSKHHTIISDDEDEFRNSPVPPTDDNADNFATDVPLTDYASSSAGSTADSLGTDQCSDAEEIDAASDSLINLPITDTDNPTESCPKRTRRQ